eukprot:22071_1
MTECIDNHEKHRDNIISILDCFHHLLVYHNTSDQLESIYKLFNCLLCKYRRRNRNNRHGNEKDRKLRCLNSTLQTISSHISYSGTIGCCFNKHERLQIAKQTSINGIINRNHKFTTFISTANRSSISHYSYSYPFIYNPKFKHSKMNILEWKCHELYVSSKYQTLKDELLLNQVCTIEMFQWELVLQKTKYHLKTEHFKSLYADTQN